MTNSETHTPPPLFSVVVTTFNRPEMLVQAVNSVLSQTIQNLECIVVDDAGTHPLDHLPSDPRVRLIRRDYNGGSSAARNTGLRLARGRYVTFLDDDDLYTNDRLAVIAQAFVRAPVVICWRTGSSRKLEGDVADVILDDLVPSVGQTAVTRDVVPLFDEELRGAEDIDWWLRLALAVPVTTVPAVCYVVRSHVSARHGNDIRERIDGSQRILDRHREYFDRHRNARAFRLKRIGLMYLALNDRTAARSALLNSFRTRPSSSTLWHVAHAFRPLRRAQLGRN